jgi:hypothetical protein
VSNAGCLPSRHHIFGPVDMDRVEGLLSNFPVDSGAMGDCIAALECVLKRVPVGHVGSRDLDAGQLGDAVSAMPLVHTAGHDHDLVALPCQACSQVCPDEACTAGDRNSHQREAPTRIELVYEALQASA